MSWHFFDGLDLLQERPDGLQVLCDEQGRFGLPRDREELFQWVGDR